MQTNLPADFIATSAGQRANEILRSCVHCGFCNATCPTYQLSGDELDGPRGRIYLIKELLEGGYDSTRAMTHLDRCLTCRACETTCPSGVAYGELAEIARVRLGPSRSGLNGLMRQVLRWLIPYPKRLSPLVTLASKARLVLPKQLRRYLPEPTQSKVRLPADFQSQPRQKTDGDHDAVVEALPSRQVVILQGCVQRVVTAEVNTHLQTLLAARGIKMMTVQAEACCGALDLHLGAESAALKKIKANIDALAPLVGLVDAIISTASGCGVTFKDYPRLLADDPEYAKPAVAVAGLVQDVAEYVATADLDLAVAQKGIKVAWHPPCSLQHGQQVTGVVEELLTRAGCELVPVADAHLCCGSAGTYSILQPARAKALREEKLEALQKQSPDVIVTANVGCQTFLAQATPVAVRHWIELLK